jgi:uncharacterized protein
MAHAMPDSRRLFLQTATAAAVAAAAPNGLPKRTLGKTGLEVSILGLGGARIGNLDDGKTARDVVRRCYDLGVTYFDAAAAGAYGLSQARYGAALHDVRDKIVLATKTRHRTAPQAQLDLDQSLANFRTDRIDLYQVHNVMTDADIDDVFRPGGLMEMIEKAKKAGKIRFVGFTGHTDPRLHNKIMTRYNFDTVLLPLSITDGGNSQKSFESETLPQARKHNLGIIAMKLFGAGAILKRRAATVAECLSYTWSLPIHTAIVGIEQLDHAAEVAALAASHKPLTAAEMDQLRRRAATLELAQLEPWKYNDYSAPTGPIYKAD